MLEFFVKDNIFGIEIFFFIGGREGFGFLEFKSFDFLLDLFFLFVKYFFGTENFRGILGVVFELLEKENNLLGLEIFRFGDVRG